MTYHSLAGHAQTLQRQVVAAGGADYTKTNFSLSVTVGEPVVQTITNAHNILTQGFQQPPENSAALPLQWLSFTAVLSNGQSRLQWVTAQEFGNDYFDIQRSADGLNFVHFITVKSRGDNAAAQYYYAIDPSPFTGKTFYRIRQIDKDGHFSYSIIVAVFMNGESAGWSIFPDPVATLANIEIHLPAPQQLKLQLFDTGGRLLMVKELEAHAGVNNISWDMHGLNGGVYIISSNNNALPVIKLLKK